MMLLAHTVEIVAAGILDILQRTSAQYAILELLIISLDIEINRTVALVGKAIIQNLLHQLLLFDDMSCGMWLDAWRQHAQSVHRLMVAVGVVLCHLHGFQLLQTGLLGYLVLTLVGIVLQVAYIGDVAHIAYFVADMLQIAEHHVESDGRTSMP